MAYIAAETAKTIRQEIKATFPKGWKFSITISHHSSLNIVLLSSNIDDSEHESNYINTHYLDDNKTPFGLVFQKIDVIVNRVGEYYDNSDITTDYHNTAFYKNYSVGSWSKDYIYNAELPAFAAADQYCPEVQIDHGTKENYLQIWFSDKPTDAILNELKAAVLQREEERKQYLADQAVKTSDDDEKRVTIESASNEHKKANSNKQINNKFIPVNVFVLWSESGYFIENTLYTLAEFEKLAKQAADERGKDSGYYKTKCNIIWSDGYEWSNARIDLAVGDEIGATDHLKQYCDYYGNADNLTKTGIQDPQKQLDEITEFLRTHHLHVPSDTKTNVIDFNKAQADKKEELFFNGLLDAVEVPNYKTDKLNDLLSATRKIVYFSGDVEKGEARNVSECDKEQLLRAASLQHFQIVDLHYIVRLVFDGDYFYDLYVDNDVSELLTTLNNEIDENYSVAEITQNKFNSNMNKLLH